MTLIGRNIKKIRTIKKMSQAQFAELFNLARPSVGAYEEGRSEPKLETLKQIARLFKVSIDDLLSKELTINDISHFSGPEKTQVKSQKSGSGNSITRHILIRSNKWNEYVKKVDDQAFLNQQPRFFWPGLEGIDARAFEWPEYLSSWSGIVGHGDFLITRKLIKLAVFHSSPCIFVTDKHIIFKQSDGTAYQYNDNNGWVKSDHSNAEPREIWQVVSILKKYDPEKSLLTTKITELEQRMDRLEGKK